MKIIVVMTITTIPVSKKFHDWLKSKGKKGESYEDVIKRLLQPEFQQELEEGTSKGSLQQEPSDDADDKGNIDNL